MKIVSWNLNGVASCVKNKSFDSLIPYSPDIVCCQEIRTEEEYDVMSGYHHYWFHSGQPRYSGTLVMTKNEPLNVYYGFTDDGFDAEGRLIVIELKDCFVVNTYTPRSEENLRRHLYRMEWDERYREYLTELSYEKPVIACGDFNAARLDIDIYPENMRMYFNRQGYATEEVANLEKLIESGFVDAYRELYPDKTGAYTWWANRRNKRAEDRGWRLDYFFVSEEIADRIIDVVIHSDIQGSDHCPIELEIDI